MTVLSGVIGDVERVLRAFQGALPDLADIGRNFTADHRARLKARRRL